MHLGLQTTVNSVQSIDLVHQLIFDARETSLLLVFGSLNGGFMTSMKPSSRKIVLMDSFNVRAGVD